MSEEDEWPKFGQNHTPSAWMSGLAVLLALGLSRLLDSKFLAQYFDVYCTKILSGLFLGIIGTPLTILHTTKAVW